MNNMFKGQAEIIVYEKQEDGSLKESYKHKQNNKICITVIENLLNRDKVFHDDFTYTSSIHPNRKRRIGIFSNTEVETFDKRTANAIATGDDSLISDSYIRTSESDTEPANVVYKNRFLAPSTERTFYSLGICFDTAVELENSGNGASRGIFSYILLNTPITQTTNQVLDINYKVFIDWEQSTLSVSENGQRDIERLFLGETSTNGAHQIGFEKNQFIHGATIDENDEGLQLFNYWYNWNEERRTQILGYLGLYQDTFNLTNRYGAFGKPFIGSFARGLQYGGFIKHNPKLKSHIGRELFNKSSNLSSVYSHSLGADKPMYDANKLANSSWQPVVEDDDTVKEFPAHYILKVSKAGGLGVGEYKLYKAGWQGWSGNRYEEAIGCPFLNFDLSLYYVNRNNENHPVTTNYDCYNHRWNYTWSYGANEHNFVSYVRNVGVCLFKLSSENLEVVKKYTLKDNLTMGDFIEDIEIVPTENLIYVATRTGLFKINTSTDVITQEATDRCMSVVVGYQNKVFAVFLKQTGTDESSNPIYEGRISNDEDYSVALANGDTLDASDLPNYNNTWRLFINKESTTFEMVLIIGHTVKGRWDNVGSRTNPAYWMYWRNEAEFIKKQQININTNQSYTSVSDLMCFPSNNSIICDNNIWIYALEKYQTASWYQVRYQFNLPHGEDLKEDFINTGWNTREARYYDWAAVGNISEDPNLYTFPNTSGQSRYVPMGGKIGLGRFAEEVIGSYYTYMDTPGDLHKSYEGEGLQYKIRILMEHWVRATDSNYNPNVGGGSLSGWPEGSTAESGQWDGNHIGNPLRLAYFVDVDLNLEENTADITVKGGDESISRYSLRSYSHPDFGSIRRTSEKQIICFPRVGTVCSKGFYMLSPFRYPDQDLKDTFIQAYKWDGNNWQFDNDNTGAGKPLHTATEPLLNGLSVGWKELAPDDSQDLVLDQYYTFTRTTAENMIPIEEHTPSFNFYYWFSYRRRKEKSFTATVPANRILFVPDAPDGTSPDLEWKGLTNSGLLMNVTLDGEQIGMTENGNTNPPAGTTYYSRSLGRFYFNDADVGKTAVINYTYYLKYDDSEQ